ncbi:MAG: hypothetical protein V1875_02395 [Candidatus Altiarchaeota archaeon]
MKRKGMFFTISIVLLVVPLILFVAYYYTSTQTKVQDTISKVRCDELHYFVEDVREDMERALVIFGRRAAIYALSDVVEKGSSLGGYVFNCTSTCRLDCSKFAFAVNGSEAAIAELSVCGTLYGRNVSYMANHTLSQWITRIETHGSDMHFNVSIDLKSVELAMSDPWTFHSFTNSTFKVYDEAKVCYFVGDSVTTSSATSILGLEDPLFPLYTGGQMDKYMLNCTVPIILQLKAGCSADPDSPGNGTASGYVVFDSDIGDADTYCQNTPGINGQILVLDGGFGSCNAYEGDCFNASSPNHFAGVLDYGPNNPQSFINKCDVTIPWLMDTGDIDDEAPRSPPRRVPSCAGGDIADGECIQLRNSGLCGIHDILLGCPSDRVNTTCYQASNASLMGGFDGPSFFDRLDGSLRLGEKYLNQSMLHFNTTLIGVETLVNPYVLDDHDVKVKSNASWVDYLYWNGTYGCAAIGTCSLDEYNFRFDDPHASIYSVDTSCVNVTGCGISESCVDDVDEDLDGLPDWLDPSCAGSFAECGTIISCDPTDSDYCGTCDYQSPKPIAENTQATCLNYGYNDTEWHFYSVTPTQDGLLTVRFNGTATPTGNKKTDMVVYNYTERGCSIPVEHDFDMERNYENAFCVGAGQTYVVALDSDSVYGENGAYNLSVTLTPGSPSCPAAPSTMESTSSSSIAGSSSYSSSSIFSTSSYSSSSASSSSSVPCGFFDDMEDSDNGWTHDGANEDWERGTPTWLSADGKYAYSGTDCWATNLNGNYANNMNGTLLSPPIYIPASSSPLLLFHVKYSIEYYNSGTGKGDRGFVEASSDGINWDRLGVYSNTVSDQSQNGWIQKTYSLDPYRGGNVRLRYRLRSDGNIRRAGLYIDDVNVTCS